MATKNVNTEAVQAEETEKKEAVNILDLLLGSDVGEIKLPTKEVEITRLSQVYGAPFILTIKAITPGELIVGAISNPYVLSLVVVSVWNTLNDPTTKGLGDSARAKSYTAPQ